MLAEVQTHPFFFGAEGWRIEPRHFGALSGLGIIFRSLGQKEQAKAAFRAALDVDPHLKDVRDELDSLEAETAGRDT